MHGRHSSKPNLVLWLPCFPARFSAQWLQPQHQPLALDVLFLTGMHLARVAAPKAGDGRRWPSGVQ